MDLEPSGVTIAEAVERRHRELAAALADAPDSVLAAPSKLPGWDRLTIVCHLRYGAVASRRMSDDALAGRATAFYPDGRSQQRASTLEPAARESPSDVVASFEHESSRVDALWQGLDDPDWRTPIEEPAGARDLGTITLRTLALLRLTEVEVHGADLDLGLSPWSTTFVQAALPMRLRWLATRRSNDASPDTSLCGSWALRATDGTSYVVRSDGRSVTVTDSDSAGVDEPRATIEGTGVQLLALVLGRVPLGELTVHGDVDFAAAWLRAFPPP